MNIILGNIIYMTKDSGRSFKQRNKSKEKQIESRNIFQPPLSCNFVLNWYLIAVFRSPKLFRPLLPRGEAGGDVGGGKMVCRVSGGRDNREERREEKQESSQKDRVQGRLNIELFS